MLKSLSLRNFRTCVETDITFEPVTLLVGRNNAGKTSVCQALDFLSHCATARSLDEAARTAGIPPRELRTRYVTDEPVVLRVEVELGGDGPSAFTYELTVEPRDTGHEPGAVLNVVSESLSVRADGVEACLWERRGTSVTEFTEPGHGGGGHEQLVSNVPAARSMLASVVRSYENSLAEAFALDLESWRCHRDFSPPAMLASRRADYDPFLVRDASNLASALFALKSEDTRTFTRFIELVREIEPSIETINFVRPRPEEVYMEVEDTEGHGVYPESLSGGTLRYMALCYLALQGSMRARGRDVQRPRLISLEEPDQGLYVGQLRRLVEVLQEAGKAQQTIITTHNPYLIDLFEDHPEQVRLVRRGDLALRDGTTVAPPDAAQLEKLLESFPLGELYYRELLQ